MFLLNAVRIAALILIGDAGAPRIAMGGFHSQAGWIAFNMVALGFSVAARNVPWVTIGKPEPQTPPSAALAVAEGNATAAYLTPFLAILGAGMISVAGKGDFEWLYPLRFFAAAGMLWVFRKRYASLDWKAGWFGPAIGALVFVIWMALDRWWGVDARAMPSALTAASAPARAAWIAVRCLAAIVTVPLAEELAFRGYLLRRLISPDFESLGARSFTWCGLLVSSVLFGLLHGDRWLAGTLAGALYALTLIRRGRMGEAVAAHATSNALLAVSVLWFHQWQLW
jgi:exosortase E/protease (VPEID-CTERM system)